MLARMLGVARLNVATFEDVEHDSGATLQAMLIVIAVSIATGVGTLLAGEADLLKDVVFGVLRSLLSWAVWALLAWFVGSKILGTRDTQADWGQLARGTGFAQTPGILKVFIFIPILGLIIELVAALWQFAAMVIAVRQSLDYTSTLRAFAVVLSSGPHHQDSGEAKIRESTAGVSRKPSSDGKARGCSSKHLCGLTAWNT